MSRFSLQKQLRISKSEKLDALIAAGLPSNTLLDENGHPITDENNSLIVT